MKNKVKIVKKDFYVNKSKEVITCVLECTTQFEEFLQEYPYIVNKKLRKLGCNPLGYFTVVASTRCLPSDLYNESKGRKIAESKAKKAMYGKACKIWKILFDSYCEKMRLCSKYLEACATAKMIEEDHIKELDDADNN